MKLICIFLAMLWVAVEGRSPIPPKPGKIAPPLSDCGEDIENQKFHKESCTKDTECFGGPNSMVCKDNTCQCAENYETEERFVGEKATQTVCTSAPSLFYKCKSTCTKPATCLPYSDDDTKGKDIKVCQCAKPFVYEEGLCQLKCNADEIYDASVYKCIKGCKADEVKVNDTCKPLVGLSGKCEVDKQCLSAYAKCKENACACREGFEAKKDLCVPKAVVCPTGEALKDGGEFKKCHSFYRAPSEEEDEEKESSSAADPIAKRPSPYLISKLVDDCPKDNFCLVSTTSYSFENGSGYCCPKLKADCPVGSPHLKASCTGGAGSLYCPWETHFCFSGSYGSSSQQLCCPRQCPSDSAHIDGKCRPRVKLGEKCVDKRQCGDTYSDCVKGVCQCQEGAKKSGSSTSSYCTIECKPDEVLHENKCQKRSKLGETCKKSQEWRCPENAFCNKNKLCACQCAMFTLVDNVCAPAPICQPPRLFPYPMSGDARGGAPPPTVPRISDEERDKLLKNVTFCAIKGVAPPQGAKVGKCSAKEYCSSYITNLGLCCARPEPYCPANVKPKGDKQCSTKEPLSCGLEHSCFKYLYSLDEEENDKKNTHCCPRSPYEIGQ